MTPHISLITLHYSLYNIYVEIILFKYAGGNPSYGCARGQAPILKHLSDKSNTRHFNRY